VDDDWVEAVHRCSHRPSEGTRARPRTHRLGRNRNDPTHAAVSTLLADASHDDLQVVRSGSRLASTIAGGSVGSDQIAAADPHVAGRHQPVTEPEFYKAHAVVINRSRLVYRRHPRAKDDDAQSSGAKRAGLLDDPRIAPHGGQAHHRNIDAVAPRATHDLVR
jgi:hypothetical protein